MRILVNDCSGHAFTAQLSRELANRGHRVLHVYCSSFLSPRGALKRLTDDPIELEIRDLPLDRPFERFSYSGYSYARRIRQEVAYGKLVGKSASSFGADVVLSSNAPLFAQLRTAVGCRLRGTAFVLWLQDFYSVPMREEAARRLGRAGRVVGRVFDRAEQALAHLSTGIVTISEDFEPKLAEWDVDPSKVVTIRNWASIERLPTTGKENAWSREHDLGDRPVLLYSGTLGLKHNPGLLWRLAKHLDAVHPESRLVVASEGTGMDWLKAQAAQSPLDQLVLLPYQPFERYAEVLASADVLIGILEAGAGSYAVPSKILSYLCAGRPILAAMPQENLASRTIVDSGGGVVVPPGNEDEFLRRANELLLDTSLRRDLGRNARQYAEEHFDVSKVADRFLERLDAALRSSRAAPIRRRIVQKLVAPGSTVTSVLRPLVNRMVPKALTEVSVLAGPARGMRIPVRLREEKFYWTGLYETEVQEALVRFLRLGGTFWDVGAHAGFFSAFASRLVGPEGAVVAFEPLPANRDRLAKTLEANSCSNVTVMPVAVGDRCGKVAFYSAPSSFMWSLLPTSPGACGLEVECVTLDSLGTAIALPDLVKLDVEGAEVQVLRAGVEFLRTVRPVVIVEMASQDQRTVGLAKGVVPFYRFEPCGPRHQLLLPC